MGFMGFIYKTYQIRCDPFRKLARDLGITQKTAWHMLHRIRKALDAKYRDLLAGTVEIDEAYIGGMEKNKHESKRLKVGGERPLAEADSGWCCRCWRCCDDFLCA